MTLLLSADSLLDSSGAVGDSVLIDGPRVIAVGRKEDLFRPGVEHLEHPSSFIVPGLRDGHIHLAGWAALGDGLDLGEAADLAGVRELVMSHAARLGPGEPIIGSGLDDTRLSEGRLPDRYDLDRIEATRPILLYRHCSHVAVANSVALQLAGIETDPPAPPGGAFDRMPSGEPSGVLRESAIGLVSRVLEPLVPAPSPDTLLVAARRLVSLGITRIDAMAAAGTPLWCGTGEELDSLIAIAGEIPLEVTVYVITDEPRQLLQSADRIRNAGGNLRFGGWKGFADGSLGGHTAALRQPYADQGGRGMVLLDEERDRALIEASLAAGGGVALHAIGDRANDLVLDLLESCIGAGADSSRLRIEHASMLDPAAIERFAALGITASVQPSFVSSDGPWVGERVGARLVAIHPFASMLAAGIPLRGGSDAPVEHPDPWRAMGSALAHATNPKESVSAAQAFGMYQTGPLRSGSAADLVVVDRNPLTTDHLQDTRVTAVWKDGKKLV
jgi:predicted amidohydrolase YtcJ